MPIPIRGWAGMNAALGALLLYSAVGLPGDASHVVVSVAASLAVGIVAVLAFGRRLAPVATLEAEGGVLAHPYRALFLISFVALFAELAVIRYCQSQVRIFSFYKNVPLIACFLGLGLGCSRAGGRARNALLFLLWLLPILASLSAGSVLLSRFLGRHAAIGSSEQILGDYIPVATSVGQRLPSQIGIALFCVATFVALVATFAQLGRLMGSAFERVERLPGYTANILGSLAGILAFVGVSFLELPPWCWFALGLAPLVAWLPGAPARVLAAGLVALAAGLVFPSHGDTVWSRYQKLVGQELPHPGAEGSDARSYRVEISDVFYQVAVDRTPETLAATGTDPLAHYDEIYRDLPPPGRVLIVGAGTGNDVAAALRAGASHVDAVDIDPAIIAMGRAHHPERPYDDPRVRVIVDDARHAFRALEPGSYDVVLFGLLDSHTQLGMSSVRLDNYVFTRESFEAAVRLLAPGGHLVVTAATFRSWFRDRLHRLTARTAGTAPKVLRHRGWTTFIARADPLRIVRGGTRPRSAPGVELPTDDWPFLYLPERGIPLAYLFVVAALALASVLLFRVHGLELRGALFRQSHFFFLGAAFLLMEVHAIDRLALSFGTTWLVAAVTIALVLLLVVAANLTALRIGTPPYAAAYAGLAVSLGASYWIEPAFVLGRGAGPALLVGAVLLSPVFLAGLIFARSFRAAASAPRAMGANLLGAVLGGWTEYAVMALGVRSLVLLAAGFYALSLASLWLRGRAPDPTGGVGLGIDGSPDL